MLNKSIISILILLLFSHPAFSQIRPTTELNKNYHLIYLDISRTQDRQNLTLKLEDLFDDIMLKNDDFLLYLSNGYKPEVLISENNDKEQKDYIISLLQTMNSGSPILMFDKDSILDIWDRNDIKTVTTDNKTRLLYKNIYFHYFISSFLFKLEEEELIDRFLLVKDLTKKHIDPQRIIIDLLFSRDDEKGFIERQNQLAEKNITGYKYLFNSY